MKTALGICCLSASFYSCSYPTSSSVTIAKNAKDTDSIANGIYYWKTNFTMSPQEVDKLKEKGINRIYLKLFDVDFDVDYDGTERSIPIATTTFADSLPKEMDIVPVVYVTQSAIKNDPNIDSLLYLRIRAMGKRHGFDQMQEIQLDCDWTTHSRYKFFNLCSKMRKRAHADNIKLSATIRLHQLTDSVPPVDRGTLMLYNTGSLYDYETDNSILSYNDVQPYLVHKIHYELPLSMAYPTFRWIIWLHNKTFHSILHYSDLSNPNYYKKIDENKYEVLQYHELGNHYLGIGDELRIESPTITEILAVKALVESRLDKPKSNILYHFDMPQLSRYSDNDLETILK